MHCAGGYRASVAASMLDARGRTLGRDRRHLRQRRERRAAPGGPRGVTPRPRGRRRRAHRAQPGRARRRRLDPRGAGAGLPARPVARPGDDRFAGGRRGHLADRRGHRPPGRQRAARPGRRLRARRHRRRGPRRQGLGPCRRGRPARRLRRTDAARRRPDGVASCCTHRGDRTPPHAAATRARRPDHHLQPDLRLRSARAP